MVAVTVPHHRARGQNATLLCEYQTRPNSLYSLKWYKDEKEFYRFLPWNQATDTQVFDLPGVKVDVSLEYSISIIKSLNLIINDNLAPGTPLHIPMANIC